MGPLAGREPAREGRATVPTPRRRVTGSHRPAWVDSHCHLPFLSGGPEGALDRARAAGVAGMVTVGTDVASSRDAIGVARHNPDVRATVGLHPHDASRFDDEWDELRALAREPEVVAVGECGFDLYYNHSPHEAQERAFREQIRLARELERPLIVHTRDAWEDTFRVLDDEPRPDVVVFHCFTGGPDEARRALASGAFLSFSGIVSFKNADAVRAAAALTPLERMLVETDAPYLAPVPHRGRENEPAFVPAVGAVLAVALDLPVETVAAATRTIAEQVFRVSAGR
ncbi:MAG: TatD family hydrolase [Actinobacteria bacterium]|nr:TatD family hydrolase [Actinomycetota bacterium]